MVILMPGFGCQPPVVPLPSVLPLSNDPELDHYNHGLDYEHSSQGYQSPCDEDDVCEVDWKELRKQTHKSKFKSKKNKAI